MKGIMRRVSILPLLLSAACGSAPGMVTAAVEGPCIHALDYGAIADDTLDDRVALQLAINAAMAGPKCVDVCGFYYVTRDPRPNKTWIASLIASGIEIRGCGAAETTIAMLGGIVGRRDWRILDVSGEGSHVHDLALDGSSRCPGWTTGDPLCTDDQTHLLQVNGPASGTVLERLVVTLPPLDYGTSGGDCIRLLGAFDKWITNTVIQDIEGPDCDRSLIGFQRALDGVAVRRVHSVVVGDQSLDFEPTGETSFAGLAIMKNVLVENSVLSRGPNAQGAYTIGINGGGESVIENLRIQDTIVEDGGMFLSDVRSIDLVRLHLRNVPARTEPTVLAQKRVQGLRFIDTNLERVTGSVLGSVLKVNEHSGNAPETVSFSGGGVYQRGEGTPISTTTLGALTMVGSKIVYEGTDATRSAIVSTGQSGPAGIVVLVDTVIQGGLASAVKMAGNFLAPPVLVRVTGP